MATYTSYLNLKKPAASEQYNVLDWNNNWDAVDAAISKTGYTTTTASTLSELETAMNNALDSAKTNSEARIRVSATASFGFFISGEVYFIDIKKAGSTTYSTAIISRTASPEIIKAWKGVAGWYYSNVCNNFVPAHSFSNNDNMDNFKDVGSSYMSTNAAMSATLANFPFSSSGGRVDVIGQYSNSNYIRQVCMGASVYDLYTRCFGTEWSGWQKFMLAKNPIPQELITKTAGTSVAFTVPTSSRHFVVATSAYGNQFWIGFVFCDSSGTVTPTQIIKGANITIAGATNKITFTQTSSSSMQLMDFASYGSNIY